MILFIFLSLHCGHGDHLGIKTKLFMERKSDFQLVFEQLSFCTAMISCGCCLSDDDRFWFQSLLRKAKEFVNVDNLSLV